FTYSWLPTSSSSPTLTNLAAGFYTCVITNTCGSMSSETVQITQPANVSVTATGTTAMQCAGDAATLTASGSGGSGSFSYTWNPGAIVSTVSVVFTPTV